MLKGAKFLVAKQISLRGGWWEGKAHQPRPRIVKTAHSLAKESPLTMAHYWSASQSLKRVPRMPRLRATLPPFRLRPFPSTLRSPPRELRPWAPPMVKIFFTTAKSENFEKIFFKLLCLLF